MLRSFYVLFLLLGFSLSPKADACSCPFPSVAEEFERATEVVSAKVVSRDATFIQVRGEGEQPVAVERVVLSVLKVWKGRRKPDDRIELQNVIEDPPRSSCVDRNTTNKPQWVDIAEPGVTVPDTWLIYGHGTEPYRLTPCSHSSPLPWLQATDEIRELDAVSTQQAQR